MDQHLLGGLLIELHLGGSLAQVVNKAQRWGECEYTMGSVVSNLNYSFDSKYF